MITIPPGELVFSALAWISMVVYFYLFCKLLKSRHNIPQFKSSYYSLFLLQCIADFYVFIVVELIMRPRKFNYFDLFSEKMKSYAFFSMANLMISLGVQCSGHIVIAMNRLTAFYWPLKQEKIWNKWVIIVSVVSLWILSAVTPLSFLIIHHDQPHFFLLPSGVIQMSAGAVSELYCYLGSVVDVITVAVCSVCYVLSYKKARGRRFAIVEKRLFLCAIASAIPFCIDMVCAILVLFSFKLKNSLYRTVSSLWFYEKEATMSASVWFQLIINKSVRDLILRRLTTNQQNKSGNRVSTVSVTPREKL